MLTLYTHPQSRGRIARWMLEETGQPYEAKVLTYGQTMKAPDYLALNPMGKVPTLDHDGRIVTEGAAICAYLADAFPEAGLMPANRAPFYRWLFFAAGPLEQAIVNRALGAAPTREQKGFVGYGDWDDAMAGLRFAVAQADPWLCGPTFSAADLYLGSQIGYGLRFGSVPSDPALVAYWERMQDRPARLRAAAIDDALLAAAQP